MGSPNFSISIDDLKKVGTGALLAAFGAGAYYLIHWAGMVDWGPYTPIVVAALGVATNLLRKYVTNTEVQ